MRTAVFRLLYAISKVEYFQYVRKYLRLSLGLFENVQWYVAESLTELGTHGAIKNIALVPSR